MPTRKTEQEPEQHSESGRKRPYADVTIGGTRITTTRRTVRTLGRVMVAAGTVVVMAVFHVPWTL
jgi:hypothetical protein